jgi:UDP-N-acetylmuramate dehydrogenase
MIAAAARDAMQEALGDQIRFDVPMSRSTSLRVGGPADALAAPRDRAELSALLRICAAHRVPHSVIGAGFNTVVLDGGIDGVVLNLGRWRMLEERPGGALRIEAGVSHSQLTNFCTPRGLAGLEFGAGIPGSVGGWMAMNAGIPDHEVKDVIREVEVMSPTGRSRRHLHRDSLRGLAPGSVLVSGLFSVQVRDPARVRARVDELLARRQNTQPLDVPSCGSVFKNPPGDYAGRLIESAGLKGARVGGAQISPVHANFITNLGDATARDVLMLIEQAQAAVLEAHEVRLVPEVRIVGRKT